MRRRFPLVPSGLLSLLACSGPAAPDAVVDDPGLPPPTGSVTALVTPAGASLSVTTEDGVVVTVSIPPSAVGSSVDVTLRPLPTEAGRWFSVELEPAWLRLYAPFDVKAALPATVNLGDAGLALGSGAEVVHLPTRIDPVAHTISSTSLTFLGFPSTASGAAGAPARTTGPGGNQIGAGPATCAGIESSAQAALDDLTASGAQEAAIRVVLNASALLQKEGCDPSGLLDRATPVACEQSEAAVQRARTTPIVAYGDFERQVGDILTWAGLLDLLGAECSAADTWLAALDPEIADFLAFFDLRAEALTGYSWATFQDLRQEALTVMALYGTAWALGVSPAASQKLLTEAFDPTVSRMREVGFALCRDDDWHYPLSRMTSTGLFSARDIIGQTPPRAGSNPAPPAAYADFTDSDIFRDLQLCGTRLDIEGVVTSGGTLGSQTAGAQGGLGQYTEEVSLSAPTRGQLRFDGDLFGFTCWNDVDADSEIEIALAGTVVRTLERDGDGYLGGAPLEIDIGAIADSAGITPQGGASHQLVFTRVRSACDERLWGPERFELLDVTLEWQNPTLEVEVVLPDTLQVGSEYETTVYVDVVDPLGEPARFADVDVTLNVEGATASMLSGTTDASGAFRTTLMLEDAGVQAVTVVADALSFEGVQGSATRTAAVVGAGARMVYSRFRASGEVSIGATIDQGGEVVTGTYGYEGSFSVAVSEEGAGNITMSGSLAATVSVDAQDRITAIDGQASSSLQKAATGSRVHGSGGGNATVRFEVVGAPIEVTLSASVFGRPENYSTSVGAETGVSQVRLSERNARDHSLQVREILFVTAWTLDPPIEETVTLNPGVYEILGVAGTNTGGGSGCMDCQVDAEATVDFRLTFGGG